MAVTYIWLGRIISTILSDLKIPVKIPFHLLLNVVQKQKKKKTSLIESAIITEKIKTDSLEAKHARINKIIDLKEDFFKIVALTKK